MGIGWLLRLLGAIRCGDDDELRQGRRLSRPRNTKKRPRKNVEAILDLEMGDQLRAGGMGKSRRRSTEPDLKSCI